ncbi:MAG: hypothetical protein FJ135_04805 [Deltaproteobacteria bacterium]|nr:hypothetical protein [Deltaproteobacteria bacterium]
MKDVIQVSIDFKDLLFARNNILHYDDISILSNICMKKVKEIDDTLANLLPMLKAFKFKDKDKGFYDRWLRDDGKIRDIIKNNILLLCNINEIIQELLNIDYMPPNINNINNIKDILDHFIVMRLIYHYIAINHDKTNIHIPLSLLSIIDYSFTKLICITMNLAISIVSEGLYFDDISQRNRKISKAANSENKIALRNHIDSAYEKIDRTGKPENRIAKEIKEIIESTTNHTCDTKTVKRYLAMRK